MFQMAFMGKFDFYLTIFDNEYISFTQLVGSKKKNNLAHIIIAQVKYQEKSFFTYQINISTFTTKVNI